MLEYEWGNPSTMMLTGDDPDQQEPVQNRQIFDHYTDQPHAFHDNQTGQHPNLMAHPNPILFQSPPQHHPSHLPSLFDTRGYAATYNTNPHPSLLSLDHMSAAGGTAHSSYFFVPKSEEVSRQADFSARIGLNLGGRTYFSSAEDDFVNRLYRRSRPVLDSGLSNNSAPRCQAEGCSADLTHAKHYHRRHKVCEFHSKASTVIAAGLTQRFCQQCSRFHLLSEFDNGKRSCRKRLADHNRRRRKSHQTPNQDNSSKPHSENARVSSSENLARSPQDSGVHSTSSETVAVSPPRMSLDCFKQRPFQAAASSSSSASSSSLFFLSG